MAVQNTVVSLPSRALDTDKAPEKEEKKLDATMGDYLMVLAERPFMRSLTADQHNIIPALASIWPELPEWTAQAYATWESINDAVHAGHLPENEPVTLHISVASTQLIPALTQESTKPSVVATFDPVNGVEQIAMSPSEPNEMKIPAGLVVVCQTAMTDERQPFAFGLGENTFGETVFSAHRQRDKRLHGDDPSPDDWKKALMGLPFYLSPHYTNQAGAILGPAAVGSGVAWQPGMNSATLQNIVSRKHESEAQRRAETGLAAVAAGAIAATALSEQGPDQQERRTYPHERRTYPHERRGPGRTDDFDDEQWGTVGMTPEARRQQAIMGRITAAAEQELTSDQAAKLIALNNESPLTPMRPEEFLATQPTDETGQGADASQRVQQERQVTEEQAAEEQKMQQEETASPFAPPAEAIAAAALVEQELGQAQTLPPSPPLAAEGLISAEPPAEAPAGTEARTQGQPVEIPAEVLRPAAAAGAPEAANTTTPSSQTPPTGRPEGSSTTAETLRTEAAAEPVRQVPPQQDERAWKTEPAPQPREPVEPVVPATSGGLHELSDHLRDEIREQPQKERERADEERRQQRTNEERREGERKVESAATGPAAEARPELAHEQPPRQEERSRPPESTREAREPREYAERAAPAERTIETFRNEQGREHREEMTRAAYVEPRTETPAQTREAMETRAEQIYDRREDEPRGANFYESIATPQPVQDSVGWTRTFSSGLSGIAAAFGLSRQARAPSNEERHIIHDQIGAEKRREAAAEHQAAQDHRQASNPGVTNTNAQSHPQAQQHRPSEEPPAPSPGE